MMSSLWNSTPLDWEDSVRLNPYDDFLVREIRWLWPYVPIQQSLPLDRTGRLAFIIPIEYLVADFETRYENSILYREFMDDGKSRIKYISPVEFNTTFKLEEILITT